VLRIGINATHNAPYQALISGRFAARGVLAHALRIVARMVAAGASAAP
jgi:hypothetical protein